jgi:hypothetical protein
MFAAYVARKAKIIAWEDLVEMSLYDIIPFWWRVLSLKDSLSFETH